MERRLSRFGVGPRIALPAIVYALLAGFATRAWPDTCLLQSMPYGISLILGILLLLMGIPMWLVGIVSVMKAYHGDRLVTSGLFALCRHPVYAAWIVLILPALVLLTRSWPLMLTPLMAYALFKLLIRKEDDYLQQRFGSAYLEYRTRVHEILPIPKL